MGDLFFTTNNRVLVDKHRDLPAIDCAQRKAAKKVVTQFDISEANKRAFGDKIGFTTNTVTAETCLWYLFSEGSEECKTLEYRMMCGQLLQQNCIDKIKGVIAKPMPKGWYDRHTNDFSEDDTLEEHDRKALYQKVVADKKPYFFIYNYSHLKKELLDYIEKSERKFTSNFNMTIKDVENKEEKTQEEQEALDFYYRNYPVITAKCVMNRICWFVERQIDGRQKI